MVNYPNGKRIVPTEEKKPEVVKKEKDFRAANRGMDFEHAVNLTCDYLSDNNIALFSKRPTPIKIVKTDYKLGKITEAYFEKQSNTDYNGVYHGYYIDFECKETKSHTALTFNNIPAHQIKHLKKVLSQKGIGFFLVYFKELDEIYLIDAHIIIEAYENKERSRNSIPYKDIKKLGIPVEQGYMPRLNLIKAINKLLNI